MVPASESRRQVKGELRAAEALNQTNATHLKDLEAAQGFRLNINRTGASSSGRLRCS